MGIETCSNRMLAIDHNPMAVVGIQAGQEDRRAIVVLFRFSLSASVVVILIAALALLGWCFAIPQLTSWNIDTVTMKVNTALALVCAAVSLALHQQNSGALLGKGFAAISTLIGVLTLVEYVAGANLGIDDLLVAAPAAEPHDPFPSRMSPITAFCLSCFGIGLLALDGRAWREYLAQTAVLVALAAALVGVIGFLYGVSALRKIGPYTSLSLPTTLCFILLGLGIFAARPRQGMAAVLTRHTTGAVIARRLLTLAVSLPLLLSWLKVRAEQAGYFDMAFGTALFTALIIFSFVALIGWTVRSLERADLVRQQAEATTAQFAAIVTSSSDAILSMTLEGIITSWNASAERLFGYTTDDIIGQSIRRLIPPERQTEEDFILARLNAGENIAHYETVRIAKDGRRIDVALTISPIKDGAGNITGASKIIQDITERKRTEEQLRTSEERLHLLHRLVANPDLTDDERLISLIRLGCEQFQLDIGVLSEITGDEYRVTLANTPDNSVTTGYVCNVRETFCHEVLKSNELFAVENVNQSVWRDHPARTVFGTEVYFGAPVTVVGTFFGTLCFAGRAPRSLPFTGGDREFLHLLAQMMGAELTRQQSDRQLRLSKARLKLAMASAAIGAFDWNVQTGVNIWTPELEAMYGLEPGEFGQTEPAWEQLVHPDDRAGAIAKVNEALATGVPVEHEWRVIWRDGSVHWIVGRFQSFKDIAGKLLRLTGMNIDVSARKQAEQDLRRYTEALAQANAELTRSNVELDAFAYIASHDLKEPLRGIHNYAQFLLEDENARLSERGQEQLATIKRLTQRMDTLIVSLGEYSRVGRLELNLQPADVTALLRRVLEIFQPQLSRLGITVRVPAVLPVVKADPSRLMEVFENLIGNAIKYNDKAERWVEIGCRTEKLPVFYVRDNGIGIKPQHREKIFQIFRRLHGRDAYGGGTGAGLTIAKKIIERHGGRIWVESVPGEGSTFYFTLGS